MSELRYRVGIDAKENANRIKEKEPSKGRGSGQWQSRYCTEPKAISALAAQIKKDLRTYRIDRPEHGSGKTPYQRLVPVEERKRIIHKALLLLAKEFGTCSTPT